MGHDSRPKHVWRHPVQVTLRAVSPAPSLRSAQIFPAVRAAIARPSNSGFRVIHFSVQRDHIHLIVEADSDKDLRAGIQGLAHPYRARSKSRDRSPRAPLAGSLPRARVADAARGAREPRLRAHELPQAPRRGAGPRPLQLGA